MWDRNWVYESGTDCVGFANRAASWEASPYKWGDLTAGWTEYTSGAGTDDLTDVFPGYTRSYPTSSVAEQNGMVAITLADDKESDVKASWFPIVADDIISMEVKKDYDEAAKETLLASLRKSIPGDIFVKDTSSASDTTGDWPRDHIAIVAYVPPNAQELSLGDLLNSMTLIEGEYTNKIQSVIKKLSVGDYNNDNLLSDKTIYPGFIWKKDQAGLSLNCSSWTIRRLK